MTDGSADVSRRSFLAAAAGGAGAVGATGAVTAQDNATNETDGADGNQTAGNGTEGNQTDGTGAEGNQTAGNETDGNQTDGGGEGGGGGGAAPEPDFGGYLDDAPYFDGSIEDMRGQESPTVTVGNPDVNTAFSFTPAAIHVDNGATVVWEWTGEGGSHNVVHTDGEFESEETGEGGFTYEYTFDEDGVYNYYCDPHEANGMLGSVVVGTDYPSVDQGSGEGPQPLPNSIKTLGVATLTTLVATLGLAYAFIKYGGSGPAEP